MNLLIRQRNFALLWSGQLNSALGDWILFVTLPVVVYSRTGSPLATAGMFIVQTAPGVVFGSVAGVYVDRWNRKHTLVVADVARALLLLLLLVLLTSPARTVLWIVYPVAFIEAVISLVFLPAKAALLPRLVGPHQVLAANALTATSDNVARLIGPALGGALLSVAGFGIVVLADSLSFVLSSVLIACIHLPTERAGPASAAGTHMTPSWRGVWQAWLDGLAVVHQDRVVVIALVSALPCSVAYTIAEMID